MVNIGTNKPIFYKEEDLIEYAHKNDLQFLKYKDCICKRVACVDGFVTAITKNDVIIQDWACYFNPVTK